MPEASAQTVTLLLAASREKEIPDLHQLDKASLAAGRKAGIYKLVDPQGRYAHMTIDQAGGVGVWGPAYSVEYLAMAFARDKLKEMGEIRIQ